MGVGPIRLVRRAVRRVGVRQRVEWFLLLLMVAWGLLLKGRKADQLRQRRTERRRRRQFQWLFLPPTSQDESIPFLFSLHFQHPLHLFLPNLNHLFFPTLFSNPLHRLQPPHQPPPPLLPLPPQQQQHHPLHHLSKEVNPSRQLLLKLPIRESLAFLPCRGAIHSSRRRVRLYYRRMVEVDRDGR